MENHVPFVGVALILWVVLVAAGAAAARRPLFAFFFGVLFTAAFVGYCMFYQGLAEMGGIIHALMGGFYGVLMFYGVAWLRSRWSPSGSGPETPDPAVPGTPRPPLASKSDANGAAPLGTASTEFASCASQAAAVQGVTCLPLAANALRHPWGWAGSVAFLGVAIWMFVQARRDRGRPYLIVRDGVLIVDIPRRRLRQVDLRLMVGVRRGWNRTTLELSDGATVVIDHCWFANGEEADRFRAFLEDVHCAGKA